MLQNKNLQDNTFPLILENVKDTFLCSYSIASKEMRYTEICSRDIFIRVDPKRGPIIRGEISGCDRGGFADLSQIFLEFGLSCEGCKDPKVAEKSVVRFGQHLGSIFVPTLHLVNSPISGFEKLRVALKCILNSINIPYTSNYSLEYIQIIFDKCPLKVAAQATGLNRGLLAARMGMFTFIDTVVQLIEPEYLLVPPSVWDSSQPLLEILVTQK